MPQHETQRQRSRISYGNDSRHESKRQRMRRPSMLENPANEMGNSRQASAKLRLRVIYVGQQAANQCARCKKHQVWNLLQRRLTVGYRNRNEPGPKQM